MSSFSQSALGRSAGIQAGCHGAILSRSITARHGFVFAPEQEIYSIDECFLVLTSLQGAALTRAIRHVPVGEVWGVGRRLAPALQDLGILTAADLAAADPHVLQGQFSVALVRTAQELQGLSVIGWEDLPAPKQQIMCSRSFGRPVHGKSDLAQALATFASRAAQKLRAQGSVTRSALVFIRTSPFRPGRQYSGSTVAQLRHPTDSTPRLLDAVREALEGIFRPGVSYAKAGVCLLDLVPVARAGIQGELFDDDGAGLEQPSKLLHVVDSLNARFGRDTIGLASATAASDAPWQMRQHRKTPAYTTDWSQVIEVWK